MGNENPNQNNDPQKDSSTPNPVPAPPQQVTPPAPQASTPNPGGAQREVLTSEASPNDGEGTDYKDVADGVQGRVSSDEVREQRAKDVFDETTSQN